MIDSIKIKEQLLKACTQFVQNRLETVTKVIESNKKALHSETKSSAGDKHETGRAMLQLEMEKAGQQLAGINAMAAVLKKISIENSSKNVCLGSLIASTKGNYFLAISVGKITLDEKDYFIISAQSPIGKQLLGKKIGDSIPFNNAEIISIT